MAGVKSYSQAWLGGKQEHVGQEHNTLNANTNKEALWTVRRLPLTKRLPLQLILNMQMHEQQHATNIAAQR